MSEATKQVVQIHEARGISMFPSAVEWAMLKEQAGMLVKTGFLPASIKTPEQAIAIALKGREIGIPPMQAFAHIHIIQGKPSISSELMLSLIFKNCPGAVVNYVQTSNDDCVIEANRPNGSAARFSFTMDDAKRADLLGKGNWKSYPGAMLRARAIAIMARALFPDAIMGCSYTPEELGAEVTDEGDVIDIPAQSDSTPQTQEAPKPVVVPKVIAPVAEPKRTKNSVGNEILVVAAQLELPQSELSDWVMQKYGKPTQQLSLAELEEFLVVLQKEL